MSRETNETGELNGTFGGYIMIVVKNKMVLIFGN